MQVKEIKKEGLSHELEITVPLKEIEGHVEARLKEVGKTVKIQGFRPGKAPMNLLKKRYGRAIMGEVLEKAVNESSAKALEKQKIKPAMQPKIEVQDFDEGKDLIYKMEVETLPEIKLADFSKMKIEKPVAKPSDKEIKEALGRIAENNATTKKIDGDRATKKGDTVLMDFDGRTADDDVHHEGMKSEGFKLELGSGQFIPGFEDQMIGKKAGEKFDVKVTFPEEYGAAELAGRDAIFEVTIHEIHEKAESEVNDELAKTLGLEDLKALKEAIEQQMQSEYDNFTRMKMKKQLLDELDAKHTIEAPARMIEMEYDSIIQQAEREQQMNPEAEALSDEDKDDLKDIAGRRVRLGLILSEVGNQEKIMVSDQELQQAVIREAQKFPGQEKAVFEFYQKNQQALEAMRAPIFEDKVVDFILGKVDVSEKTVSVEELTAEEEEETKPKKKASSSKKKSTAKKSESKDGEKKKAPAKKKTTKKS
ncbi:MAG: trigger factor [Pseudomonadota bacterium]